MRRIVLVLIMAAAGCKASSTTGGTTPPGPGGPTTTTPTTPTLSGSWTSPSQSGNLRYDLDIAEDGAFAEAWYEQGTYDCTRSGVVTRTGDSLHFVFHNDPCLCEAEDTESVLALTVDQLQMTDGGDQLTYTRRTGGPVPPNTKQATCDGGGGYDEDDYDYTGGGGTTGGGLGAKGGSGAGGVTAGSLDSRGQTLIGKWHAPSESGRIDYHIEIRADGGFIETWYKSGVYDCTRSGAVTVKGDTLTWDLKADPCIDQLGPKDEQLISVEQDEFQVTDGGSVILVYKRE